MCFYTCGWERICICMRVSGYVWYCRIKRIAQQFRKVGKFEIDNEIERERFLDGDERVNKFKSSAQQ